LSLDAEAAIFKAVVVPEKIFKKISSGRSGKYYKKI